MAAIPRYNYALTRTPYYELDHKRVLPQAQKQPYPNYSSDKDIALFNRAGQWSSCNLQHLTN